MLRSTSLSKTDLRKAHERRGVCHLAAFQCFPSLPGWPHAKPARLDFWADVKALPAISTTVPVPEQPGRDDSPAAVCYAARVGGSPVSCKSAPATFAGGAGACKGAGGCAYFACGKRAQKGLQFCSR